MNTSEAPAVELTPELQRALDEAAGKPPLLIDRRTQETYVLIRSAVYKHLTSSKPVVSDGPEVPEGIRQARAVILDTGHTHSLSLHERHLTEWAGLRPESLAVFAAVRERGQRLSLRAANIWVHPNEPGERRVSDRPPQFVEAVRGIAVYPGHDFPRLPILGLRAITENKLVLAIDGRRREATLRTRRQR